MSKKTSFLIFVVAVCIIMVAFVAKFSPITVHVAAVFEAMCGLYLSIAAVVSALLLKKQKHYWLIMLGLAVVVAAIIQAVILGGALISVALLYKIIAFIVYAYLILLMRYMV